MRQDTERDDRSSFRITLISLYNSIAPGTRVISALLKREGYSVDFVFLHGNLSTADHPDPFTPRERDLLVGLCRDLDPDLVGISASSSFLHPLMVRVTGAAREAVDAPIILGGVHITIAPERCVDLADYLCVGEGENTMLGLSEGLRTGNLAGLKDVPGLAYRVDGEMRWNPQRCPVEDLDSLPYQDIDSDGKYLLESNQITEMDPILEQSSYPTYASRGCPFNCSYCSRNLINEASGLTRAIRLRSPEHVIGELEAAQEQAVNMRSVRFWDDTFPTRRSWLEDFLPRYRERIGLPFGVWFHPKSVREETVCMMKEAGLVSVDMGIESGSERIRREIFNRPERQEDVIRASRILASCEIERMSFDLILEHEYERLEDKKETLELLLALERPFELNMHALSYLPKTGLTQRALEDGYVTEEDLEFVFEGGLEPNMRRHRWQKQPYLGVTDARDLIWPRLYYLARQPFLSPQAVRRLARWVNRNRLAARVMTRTVDLVWGMEQWRPELEHPGLVQQVRRKNLEPFFRKHPWVVFVGRLGLALLQKARRAVSRLNPLQSAS